MVFTDEIALQARLDLAPPQKTRLLAPNNSLNVGFIGPNIGFGGAGSGPGSISSTESDTGNPSHVESTSSNSSDGAQSSCSISSATGSCGAFSSSSVVAQVLVKHKTI
jgi:hypothetical protein